MNKEHEARAQFLRVLNERPFVQTASGDDMKAVLNAVNKYDSLLTGKSQKEEDDLKTVFEVVSKKVGGLPPISNVKSLNTLSKAAKGA